MKSKAGFVLRLHIEKPNNEGIGNVAFSTYLTKYPAPNPDNSQYNGKLPIAVQIQTSIVLLVSLLNCVLKTGGQESQLHSRSMKESPV